MSRMKHRPLFVSAVLNVALMAAVVALAPWQSFFSEGAREHSASIADAVSIKAALDSTSLSPETRKRLLMAYLLLPSQVQLDEYWRPVAVREARARIAAYELSENARKVLATLYGSSAAQDPQFSPVFRPLEASLTAFDSEKQVAIQRVMLASAKRMISGETSASTRPAADGDSGPSLTAEEQLEYELRESPMAKALASRGFAFTEAEFRSAYVALRGAAVSPAAKSASAAIEGADGRSTPSSAESLRAVLGDARFAQFQRTRDPIYGAIQAVGRKYNVGQSSMQDAHSLISRRWQSDVMSGASTPKADASRLWRGMSEADRGEISRLMGADAAKELFRLLDLYGSSLRGGGRPVQRILGQDMPR